MSSKLTPTGSKIKSAKVEAVQPLQFIHTDKTRDVQVDALLERAEKDPKPNFTQYQLALMEIGADKEAFRDLRELMEEKFNLPPLIEWLEEDDSDEGKGE